MNQFTNGWLTAAKPCSVRLVGAVTTCKKLGSAITGCTIPGFTSLGFAIRAFTGLAFTALAFTIMGCTQVDSRSDRPSIEIIVSEPDRIRFSGIGAGAGVMMAGAMGPMGIAIGVAIDEGIGKDIDRTAREGNVDIKTLLLRATEVALDKAGNPLVCAGVDTIEIVVERYGFVTAVGEDDPVQPQLHVSFLFNANKKQTLRIPEDFKDDNGFVFDTYPLDEVKSSARTIRQAFEEIAGFAINHGLILRTITQ